MIIDEDLLHGLILLSQSSYKSQQYSISKQAISIMIDLVESLVNDETRIKEMICQELMEQKIYETFFSVNQIQKGNANEEGRTVIFMIILLQKILIENNIENIVLLKENHIMTYIVKILYFFDTITIIKSINDNTIRRRNILFP